MTDKALLDLAAKAAGIELSYGKVPYTSFDGLAKGWKDWNPLSDDGDALRLAVKLRIDVFYGPVSVVAELVGTPSLGIQMNCGDDPYAATRRAIVRAAAEIGRTMG